MGLFTQPYRVVGHGPDGKPTERVLDATSPVNARQQAERLGFTVRNVVRLEEDRQTEAPASVNAISFESPAEHRQRLGSDGPSTAKYAMEQDEYVTLKDLQRQAAVQEHRVEVRRTAIGGVAAGVVGLAAVAVVIAALWQHEPDPAPAAVQAPDRGSTLADGVDDLSLRWRQPDPAASLTLQAVMRGKRPGAVINGRVVPLFEYTEGCRLIEIGEDYAVLSRDGRRFRLQVQAPDGTDDQP